MTNFRQKFVAGEVTPRGRPRWFVCKCVMLIPCFAAARPLPLLLLAGCCGWAHAPTYSPSLWPAAQFATKATVTAPHARAFFFTLYSHPCSPPLPPPMTPRPLRLTRRRCSRTLSPFPPLRAGDGALLSALLVPSGRQWGSLFAPPPPLSPSCTRMHAFQLSDKMLTRTPTHLFFRALRCFFFRSRHASPGLSTP